MESLNLTPAESLMIISPKSNGGEMIKLTLIDLLLKKALRADISLHEPRFLKRHYNAIIISKGELLSKLNFKPHEQLLIDLISEHNELELKELVIILKRTIKPSDYKNVYIRDPLVSRGYFERQRRMIMALIPYNNYMLTEKGLEIKSKIMKLIDEAVNLEKWMREDLPHAKAYLSVLGSHMLLLDDYSLNDIKKFNEKLSYIKAGSYTSDYYDYYLYTIPLDYLDGYGNIKSFDFLDISIFDDYDSFDDAFSDFNSENASNEETKAEG